MHRPLPNITLQALRKKITAQAAGGRDGILIRASSSSSSSSSAKGASVFSAADFNAVYGGSRTSSSSVGAQDTKADANTQDGEEQRAAWTPRHRRRPSQSRIPDCGVFIDRHGQLKVTDHEASQRKLDTVLVLSSVSTNFLGEDFARLAPEAWADKREPFLRAIPGRDPNFKRLPYWLLLFGTPAHAASYQHRLRWYHQNARRNLPVDPFKAATMRGKDLPAPAGYIDPISGEDIWKRMHQYTLLLPSQDFNVMALLPPFPEPIPTIVRNHGRLLKGGWPVRIWVDGKGFEDMSIPESLLKDGRSGGRSWDILDAPVGIEPLDWQATTEHGEIKSQLVESSWVVRFRNEDEAMKFWRLWHLRPVSSSASTPLLHVDVLY